MGWNACSTYRTDTQFFIDGSGEGKLPSRLASSVATLSCNATITSLRRATSDSSRGGGGLATDLHGGVGVCGGRPRLIGKRWKSGEQMRMTNFA